MRAPSRLTIVSMMSVVTVAGAGVVSAGQPGATSPGNGPVGEVAGARGGDAQVAAAVTPTADTGEQDPLQPNSGVSGSATHAAGGPATRPPVAATVTDQVEVSGAGSPGGPESGTAAPPPDIPFPDDRREPDPGSGTRIGECPVFPADNPWNTDISGYPLHPNSANYVASVLANRSTLHPDFGSYSGYGIPYVVTRSADPLVPVVWTAYGDESDPGPYRIPLTAPVEGGPDAGGDRHAIGVDVDNCRLYELYRAFPVGGVWHAESGTNWDLRSNALRPEGWTSADAAGLPIFPGLTRYDEVAAGRITHALRFTVQRTQMAYVHPATHHASSSSDANRPPMGLRFRLEASFDTSGFTGQSRVILEALKTYGMIVADNGSSWYISGASDPRWDDDDLNQIKGVPGSAFEVVYTGPLIY